MDENKTVVVIKWIDGDESGVYKYTMTESGYFKEFKVSGNDIPWSTFVELAMRHESFAAFREAAKSAKRAESWNISVREGMSGCQDRTINYLCQKSGLVLNGGCIHISCNNKITINPGKYPTVFDNSIWIRDLYDILYWSERQYCYQGDAEDLTEELICKRVNEFETSGSEFIDLTAHFEQKEKDFRNGNGRFITEAFRPEDGYGDEIKSEILPDFNALYVNELSDEE